MLTRRTFLRVIGILGLTLRAPRIFHAVPQLPMGSLSEIYDWWDGKKIGQPVIWCWLSDDAYRHMLRWRAERSQ